MHNFSDWVQVFAGAVATIITALAVSHKTNRADYDAIIKGKDAIIKGKDDDNIVLRKERNDYRQFYKKETEKRYAAEKKVAVLEKENEELKKELDNRI